MSKLTEQAGPEDLMKAIGTCHACVLITWGKDGAEVQVMVENGFAVELAPMLRDLARGLDAGVVVPTQH